jgi:hypothetical protein
MTGHALHQAKALAEHLRFLGLDEESVEMSIASETDAFEAVDKILAAIGEAEQHQAVLKLREEEMTERRTRFATRAASLRSALSAWMADVGLNKIERAEATLSLSKPKATVIYSADFHPSTVGEKFLKPPTREIDKAAVRAAVLAGESVIGATLGNPAPTLTIRRS